MKRGTFSWLLFAAILVGITLIFYFSGVWRYLSLASLQEKSRHLKHLVNQHYTSAVIIYITTFAFFVTISLPITALFSLLGGCLFGAVQGGLYATVAATLGGMGAFVVFRYVLAKTLKKNYAARFERFNRLIEKYGVCYILILHYSMLVPFFVMNTLASLTNISVSKYFWVTLIGILPSCFVFAFAGRQFAYIVTIRDAFSANVIIAMLLLVSLALIPVIIRWFKGPIEI